MDPHYIKGIVLKDGVPPTPDAGQSVIYSDGGVFKVKDPAGAILVPGAGGGGGSAVWTEVSYTMTFTTDGSGISSLGTTPISVVATSPADGSLRIVQLISSSGIKTDGTPVLYTSNDAITPYGYKQETTIFRSGSTYYEGYNDGYILAISLRGNSYSYGGFEMGYLKATAADLGHIKIYPNDTPYGIVSSSSYKVIVTFRYRDIAL